MPAVRQSVDQRTEANVEREISRSAALRAAITAMRFEYTNWPPSLLPAIRELEVRRLGAERFVADIVWC